MSVELPDLSSKYDSDCDCNIVCGCDSKTLETKIKELEQLIQVKDDTIKYLEKALDVSLKHEPVFVYEHCGHCPKKQE